MEDKYNLYDRIVAATYINIDSQSPKNIYIVYNPDSYTHKFFLKIGLIVGNFRGKKIHIKTKLIDFFKILFYYYPIKDILLGRCILRFTKRGRGPWLDVDNIAAFEAKEFAQDITIFEDIWKEYYQK